MLYIDVSTDKKNLEFMHDAGCHAKSDVKTLCCALANFRRHYSTRIIIPSKPPTHPGSTVCQGLSTLILDAFGEVALMPFLPILEDFLQPFLRS
jgi:hypothetical protein